MLDKISKISLATLATVAFAGSAFADHHEEAEEAMGDACAAADDMMGDACAATDDMMEDACGAAGDACAAADDAMDSSGDDGGMIANHMSKLEIDVSVPIGLSKDFVGKPISLSPDIWYTASDKLRVGLVHSAFGTSSFWINPGTSLCLSGKENGCANAAGDAEFYRNGGVRALYTVMQDDAMKLDADVGVVWTSIDPFELAARVGVKGAYNAGKVMVGFNPAVHIGVTERDAGNKEILSVPVDVGYMVSPMIWAGVQSGLLSPLEDIGDFYTIPVNVGAMYMANSQLTAGVSFGFTNLLGKNSTADNRAVNFMVGYKL